MSMNIREGLTFDDVLLVPQKSSVGSRSLVSIKSRVGSLSLNIPILSANMPSVTGPRMAKSMYAAGGFGVLHRFNTIAEAIKDLKDSLMGYTQLGGFNDYAIPVLDHSAAGISIGIHEGFQRTEALYNEGANLFFLDIAHADQDQVYAYIRGFMERYAADPTVELVAGNIATRDAALRMYDIGVRNVKVGIGPGAACTTREVTGFGVPQLTAIMEVYEAIGGDDGVGGGPDVTIVADGGIRGSGDIVKALAAGADTVMLGRMLAGCDEAPIPGVYYGSASAHVNGHNAPEGVYGTIERSGPVGAMLKKLIWGIRSGISYGGGRDIAELRENAEWMKVSHHTTAESGVRL